VQPLSSTFHCRFQRLLSGRATIESVNPVAGPGTRPAAARAAAAIVATSGLALLATACGGSKGSHVAQLGSTATQTSTASSHASAASAQQNGALAFARCMRSHRVPNWPDPDSSGRFDKSKLTPQQLGADGSRVQAARSSCNHLLPNGGSGPSPAQVQQVRAQALAFARCMRSHDVTSFPDPGSDGRIPDPASVGIDQGSPRFQAANQACRKDRPPYIPSNSAYDAWARTHTSGS
jgi:hypothetical protein